MFSLKKKWPDSFSLELDNDCVEVQVKIHARAKNYRLSIGANGNPILTSPPYGNISKAKEFLQSHSGWLEKKLSKHHQAIAFKHGNQIPLRGENHIIIGLDKIRGQVEVLKNNQGLELLVPGGEKHLQRRLKDWLKKQAKIDLEKSVSLHANNLNVEPKTITIRSQSSRWGSCSSSGRLNFNWRLILAPNFVLDYVAAHEVAHLVEMNHSHAFWEQVELTLPDMARGRDWLKKNGQQLMAYG